MTPGPEASVILGASRGSAKALAAAGVSVVILDDDPEGVESPPAVIRCPPYAEGAPSDSWLGFLLELAPRLDGGRRPVLFCTSDRGVLASRARLPELEAAFVVPGPRPDLARTLVDKVLFAGWCRERGLAIPESRIVRRAEDVSDAALAAVPLPCLVKPSMTFVLERTHRTKLFQARTRPELAQAIRNCFRLGLDAVVQEDLSQGSPVQWSLAGISSAAGLRGAVLARKLRQVPWGGGTAGGTVPMDDAILEHGRLFCRAAGPLGLFEMELRPDAAGDPKIIEVNARIWSQVDLPRAAGVNLLHLAYLHALGREPGDEVGGY